MTTFHEIYDLFLSDVIDIYFIDYENQKIDYEDLQKILKSAIVMFKHPKKNLNNIDNEFIDEDGVSGAFIEDLDMEEKELLVSYMGIKWGINKLKRGRITELQYTGSDAKVINIKTYIDGIKEVVNSLKQENRILNNNYQMHSGEKITLNKKEGIRNTLGRRE